MTYKYTIMSVATARYMVNPTISVSVVTTGPDAMAGSIFNILNITGIIVPSADATIIDVIIALPTTRPSRMPQTAPIRSATLIYFNHTLMALVTSTRPVARPRVTTVEDCTPTLPDTALITGANETRAIICSSVALKCHRTAPTTISPSIVTISHGKRNRATLKGELVNIYSSSSVPAIFNISSVASSRITSITSSTVMIPTSLSSLSTTGTASMLYLATRRATSS